MDVFKGVPLRIFNILLCNVFFNTLEYIFSICRCKKSHTGDYTPWAFNVPWTWAYHGNIISPWVSQFAFGFYSVMLTSTILGLLTMILFKPRSWCVYCPMGTMTQAICKIEHKIKNRQ